MSQLPTLISDLALILVAAGIVSILFKRLKQPVVLGYIIAGLLASPQIPFTPTVTDEANIQTWADIGVIFLLFALGLDFSFKKLMSVGVTAFISTLTIVIAMMTLGYITGMFLGWKHMDSLFLGAMLCMSSTMIVIKIFDDFGLKKQKFARVVLGILVVEDLFAVLLMVLLSTLAVSKHFEGVEMLESLFKLGEFLLFWFLIGIFLIPTFLKKVKPHLSDEILLVVSLGLCLGMVILATRSGFSSALGAFIMGSILAETIEAEKIENLVQPVKNLFGAIFFVSVGMMIDLSVIHQYIWPIVIISLVVIIGQVTFATIGVLLSGQPLKISIQSGFSLSQIGEFSYIIAALGLSLGVISNHLYPIIVAVSVITIFISPYIIKLSEPVYKLAERKIPGSWHKLINKDLPVRPVTHKNTWKKLLKDIALSDSIYLALTLMIIIVSFTYLVPFISKHIPGIPGKTLSAIIIITLISPFLRAIIAKKNRSKEFEELWRKSKINRCHLIFLIIIRIVICMIILAGILLNLFHITWLVVLPVVMLLVLLFFYSKQIKKQSILLEKRFKRNYSARQVYQEEQAPVKSRFVNSLLDKDLHLADFEIKQDYSVVGKTLKELNFRQMCGVNVVKIIRGKKRINIPGGNERIYPLDHLVVLGNDAQMIVFQKYIEERGKIYNQKQLEENNMINQEVNIEQFQIKPHSELIGKTIKTSHIKDDFGCLVVGVERENSSTMNPDINFEFAAHDIIWVVGEYDKIVKLNELWNETTAPKTEISTEAPTPL